MLFIVKFPNSSKVGRTTTTAGDRRDHLYQEHSLQMSPGVKASSMTKGITPTSSNHRVYFDSLNELTLRSMISELVVDAVESFINRILFI